MKLPSNVTNLYIMCCLFNLFLAIRDLQEISYSILKSGLCEKQPVEVLNRIDLNKFIVVHLGPTALTTDR